MHFRLAGTLAGERDVSMFRNFGLALAAIPCLVLAQEDAVVVTASRTQQRIRDAIPHTTVLTEKEIRDSQAVDLAALLRSEAGFEMAQNGGIGAVFSPLSLRGSNSARVLVLVDGVRIEDAGFSTTALQHIMLDQVERVEIARGNVSSLYGSNAVGGVIQVFTKRGQGEPAPYGRVMAGSRDTSDFAGRLRRRARRHPLQRLGFSPRYARLFGHRPRACAHRQSRPGRVPQRELHVQRLASPERGA